MAIVNDLMASDLLLVELNLVLVQLLQMLQLLALDSPDGDVIKLFSLSLISIWKNNLG